MVETVPSSIQYETEMKIHIMDCFKNNFKILTCLGLWIPEHRSTVKRVLNIVYSALMVTLMCIIPVTSEFIQALTVTDDAAQLVDNWHLTVSQLAWAWKVYITLRYRSRLLRLLDYYNDPLFSSLNSSNRHYVQNMMRQQRLIFKMYISLAITTITLFAVVPILDLDLDRLPVPAWIPMDIADPTWFKFLYVYETISLYFAASSNSCYDTLFWGIISVGCAQLDLICHKLREAIQHSKTSDLENYERLAECHIHHMKIIAYVEDVKGHFTTISFMQFFASCFIVCFTAFRVTMMKTAIEAAPPLLYLCAMLTQLYMGCYYGDQLIVKSLNVCEAAYGSAWYDTNTKNRRSILIIMARARRPLRMTTVIFTMSLSTFVAVMRSSYSYYALLRKSKQSLS